VLAADDDIGCRKYRCIGESAAAFLLAVVARANIDIGRFAAQFGPQIAAAAACGADRRISRIHFD
jgi:hypothetical protein